MSLKKLQLQILRIQQAIYHKEERLIIVVEGMDAAGKGGVIRKITETLDPRSYRVHPIGAPEKKEQGKHYLYRFWKKIPAKGMISIFDRSWYGRVLVERIEKLTPKERWLAAYTEINQFEKMLSDDGVRIIKILLKISKKEQFKRFEDRMNDPYKQWKITEEDLRNRSKWNEYAKAHHEMVEKTSTKQNPWYVIETDDKDEARERVLKIITKKYSDLEKWIESR
jgi:AMP-polyphosphate phosphotransferase